jgi:ATP-dependent helicase HrpB
MDLPVAGDIDRIVAAGRSGSVVVTAPPGSGKTTLVPAALLDDLSDANQSLILVQPRRLAARAVARWIARLRQVELGREVGYQVRFDHRDSKDTRLLVVTTGILLRRLLDDMTLDNVAAVVLDEFHERTVEMDLALGFLLRMRQTIRPDLRIAVMSATLDAGPVARRLGACPIIHSEGQVFPVQIHYSPRRDARPLHEQVAATLPTALRETNGHILVFLPGVGEILRCRDELSSLSVRSDFELLTLYGDLPAEQQDVVLAECPRRKVILSTNVAETSLTIDGVTAVIDSGTARQLSVHPSTGLPRLELVPISQASADQRSGRAGRTSPGHCWRLWEKVVHHSRLANQPPEILRTDLADALLRLFAWGERDVEAFPWLDAPPVDAIAGARKLLRQLGAIDEDDRVTEIGQQVVRVPAHPRLGRLMLAGARLGALRESAIAAALLSERDPFRAAQQAARGPRDSSSARSRSDIVDRVFALQAFYSSHQPPNTEPRTFSRSESLAGALPCHAGSARNVLRVAEQLFQSSDFQRAPRAASPDIALMQALLEAFPDRLARLRPGTQDRAVMVGGRGVRIDVDSRVRGENLFLCLELNDAAGDARVRMASAVEREWLSADLLRSVDELFFNPTRGQVEARRRTYWDDLLLHETPIGLEDPAEAAALLAQHAQPLLSRILPADDEPAGRFRARVRWLDSVMPELALPSFDDQFVSELLPQVCAGRRSIDELRKANWLDYFHASVGYDRLAEIDRLAPASIEVPSGNRISLSYEVGKPPILAVRIQELFGMGQTPRVAGGKVAVLLHLLGPNYRPQQITDDLAGFWTSTYPQVKRELRRRYPKHDWPDDPLSAAPTRSGLANSTRRGSRE